MGDIRNTYRIVVKVSGRRRPPRQGQVRATEMGLREIRLKVSNLTGFLLYEYIYKSVKHNNVGVLIIFYY